MRIRTQSVLETAAALCLSIALPTAAYAVPGLPDVRTLPNGLTLVILEDHAVPLVAVSLWIHSGSKDEIETSAGYAHFLEHMVQRGTDTVGPFEYQRLARRWGGGLSVRSNYDRTYIALTGVPSVLGDLVDAASAMAFRAALKDSEIDQELGALNQEIHGYYDEPASVAFLETLRATFPGHPYRVPMLGNLRTLGTLKHDPLFAFYRNLYVPNNMALVLAGDLDPKRAAALAAAAFGERAKSLTLAPKPAPPAAFAGHSDIEKRLNLREPSVNLTFAGPGYRHPDRPAFEVIARALSDAAGSPVQMAVVAEKSGASARVTYYGLEDAGLLYVTIAPTTPQLSYAAARAALQEILALKRRGLKEAELRALADGMVRDERLRAGILSERANALGEAALFGGVRYYWDLPEAWRKLTPADIARVAAKYLVADNFRLVLILPRETPPLPDDPKEKLHAVMDQLGSAPKGSTPGLERALYPGEEASRVTPAAWGNPRDAAGLKDPERTVLDNGLTLVVQEDHRNSLAAVSFFLRAGSGDDPPGKEGLASLLGRLFGARALAYARDQAARRGERPGALPDVQVTRDFTELRLVVSPSGVKPSLALLAEAIRRPALDDASIAAARRANLEALERSSDDPASIAFELFREKVYEGHPYAHPAAGMPAGLQAVNRDDLSAGLARNARPSGAILALAGDLSAAEVVKAARDLFGDWKDDPGTVRADGRTTTNGATSRAHAGEFTRTTQGTQSRVIVGVPGAAMGTPDFETLRLLGTSLTLQAFDDMVFKRRAAFSASAIPEGLREGGSLALQIVTPPRRGDEAVFDLQRLMRRLALEELPPGEIEVLGRVQAGSEADGIQGVLGLASTLGYREAAGLGAASYRQVFRDGAPLPPARLKETAAKYLKPEAWIVVKVGPASE